MKLTIFFIILFSFSIQSTYAQYNKNWCFGDSIRLNFSTSSPIVYHDAELSFGEPIITVSDDSGQLLFYANHEMLFNREKDIATNGEGPWANSKSTTQGILALPVDNLGKYYLFSLSNNCPTIGICLKYSLLNLNLNTGLGEVQDPKNLLLYDPGDQRLSEKLYAVKHANGRDWWVIINNYRPNNYILFLANESSISMPIIYETNKVLEKWYGQLIFSPQGDKIVSVTKGSIEVLDFDRCTGQLSNPLQLGEPNKDYYGCSFSPSGRFLYVSTWASVVNELFQYDLYAADIEESKRQIWQTISRDEDEIGQHLLGPDGKIYLTHNLTQNFSEGYSYVNQNLSIIHNPDQLGQSCDFRPHSLYVGPKRTSFGLPNLPNFDLGPLPLPTANAGQDQTLCKNEAAQLGSPTQADLEYSWSPSMGLSDPFVAQPIANPSQTTTYILTVTDPSRSCQNVAYDTITVTVSNCNSLKMPNVFSPNGDGIQDIFRSYDDFGTDILDFQVYNRWGRRMFIEAGSITGWNGRMPNGTVAPVGSYYYLIRYRMDEGETKEKKGQVMLVR